MRAITMSQYGGPEVLTEQEAAIPVCSDSQVLVELYAAAVNPVDTNIRGGRVQEVFPVHQFPHILGLDLAGVVKEAGAAVRHIKPGDRVFGLGSSGTYAEYAAAEAVQVAKLSPDISFREAAALPAVALTAWHSLFRYGKLQEGERVLIHGGAGGVGHIAIQMAKLSGAYVIATASGKNHALVRSFGADEVIDYTAVDFAEAVSGVDMVLDFIMGLDQARNSKVLKPDGRIVSIVTPAIAEIAGQYGADGRFVIVEPKREELEQIDAWMRERKIHVHISDTVPLREEALRRAHTQIEGKHTQGKIVIQIRN